ncbi:MAG: hypothetical protein J6L89_00530 [Clostridia bacterium]|nr:hypothetical protein [Clostridia bacterium]
MENKDMLWSKFISSGKVDDYLNYCMVKNGKEKAEKDEYGRSDNQRKEYR